MSIIKTTGEEAKEHLPGNSQISTFSQIKPPAYPTLETFDVPKPRFDLEAERHYRFSYFFGIDNVEFKSLSVNKVCGKITNEIEIGNAETIQLEAKYSVSKDASVEFYIIDGDKEVPILPINDSIARNEKIFFGLPLRFEMDKTKPYQIKKDGEVVSMTPEAAINANDGEYTITYTPVNAHNYQPTNSKIKIKTILRLYNETSDPPFIRYAVIRAFGGDALWRDRL